MTSLFTLLAARYPSAAQCAAALGMTRQAYSQAAQRGQLSPLYTIRAAGLLDLDPAQTILDPAQTILDHIAAALPDAERAALSTARANNVTTPINNPAPPCPDNPRQPPVDASDSLLKDYVNKSANGICQKNDNGDNRRHDKFKKNTHSITSPDMAFAVDVIRWCYAVARLPADSPRFVHYVSRWVVPEKIAAAKAAGTFDESVKNCPPIDPAWVRFVPAAMDEYREFIRPKNPPPKTQPSSSKSGKARNSARLAA